MLNIIINSISEKVKDFSKLFLKYFISLCSAWGVRSPSAPSLAPQIFIFGSSRIFQNFCARAIFSSRFAPRLHTFSETLSEISEPFSFSSFYRGVFHFFVSPCYILVYLYPFFVYVYYLFVLSYHVFIPLSCLVFCYVISCLPFCVA